MSFKQTIYDELKGEVSPKRRAILFDSKGYLTGIASNKDELKTILQKKSTCGVIADQSSMGTVGFDIPNKDVVLAKNITGVDPMLNPVIKDIVGGRLTDETKFHMDETRELIAKYNSFIDKVYPRLANKNTITVELKEEQIIWQFPNVKYLEIKAGDIYFYITELQISIQTYCGTVMIHDSNKDLYAHEIAELVAPTWGMSEKDVEEILLSGF
ncbi:hypothetical protein ACQUY5_18750 [Bacillus cereus]|uniref:hypothetical protein n=1 Tax=Bacillus cereus TaxID=1396 RepID=UPI003D1795E4